MGKDRLQTKDLITVGIFTAFYFVMFFAVGMLGHIPFVYVLLPFLLPMICGIPFMLFLTKVKNFGMVTIMGATCGALMLLTGHTFVPLLTGFLFGLLADLIIKAGGYQSKKLSIISYGVFSLWLLGMLVPLWVMKDAYDNMGIAVLNALNTSFGAVIIIAGIGIAAFLGGIAGAFLGFYMLKKHFKRAGIA